MFAHHFLYHRQKLTVAKESGDDKREGDVEAPADATAATDAANTEVQPLTDITNQNNTDKDEKTSKGRPQRERRERGPPADGIPSKTKVMVANLPYDLTEEKVSEQSK